MLSPDEIVMGGTLGYDKANHLLLFVQYARRAAGSGTPLSKFVPSNAATIPSVSAVPDESIDKGWIHRLMRSQSAKFTILKRLEDLGLFENDRERRELRTLLDLLRQQLRQNSRPRRIEMI
jgi:hypothetical protein